MNKQQEYPGVHGSLTRVRFKSEPNLTVLENFKPTSKP